MLTISKIDFYSSPLDSDHNNTNFLVIPHKVITCTDIFTPILLSMRRSFCRGDVKQLLEPEEEVPINFRLMLEDGI